MDTNNYCIIMAGGIGSRFWPMSRTSHPKQFIDILGTGETLLQQTVRRFKKVCPPKNIYIVTNEKYRGLIREQVPEVHNKHILGEPARRNTAPAIAFATYKIASQTDTANLVVAPSDHIILKEEEFTNDIKTALKAVAENNWLMTLGIKPNRPDTGYGYIQFDESKPYHQDERIRKVKTFTEKPKLELAQRFLESGDFLWNSGIFVWNLQTIQQAFQEYLPDLHNLFSEGKDKFGTPEEQDFINNTFSRCKSISIDYGVMEKAENVYVLASDFGWSDLGTWGSLYDVSTKNKDGNTIQGKNVMTYDTENCIVNVPNDKLVVLQGLKDYVVVENENTLLIIRKEDEQQIRQIVNDIKIEKGDEYV
ncbi:MAG: mannose-1-phosphate guanylyltransferase [Bacteroidales bacterium]|nr:mannose-1-phosphate guanylyltransferase [Bacteroidales bacterium]